MKFIKRFVLIAALIILGSLKQAEALSIVQDFSNSWTVGVWNYYGNVAAQQWQYQPYIANTQTNLTSVELTMKIAFSGLTVGDNLSYRSCFATGWSPAAYQFYDAGSFQNVSETYLTINKDFMFTSPSDLSNWTNPLYGPNGVYYFESISSQNPHTVNVFTQLTYNFNEVPISDTAPVPEPGTMVLLGFGMVGLVVYGKRRQNLNKA